MFIIIGSLIWVAVVLWLKELTSRSEVDFSFLHLILLPKLILKQLGIVRIVILYLCLVATGFLVLMQRLS